MTPNQLSISSFAAYPAGGREFASEHLSLLRRLPLAVCPSFLRQIQSFETSFPAEQRSLQWQCEELRRLPMDRFNAMIATLAGLSLSAHLQTLDWVQAPAVFITDLTAYLWSSGQVQQFRAGVDALFAAIPKSEDNTPRLVFAVLGQGAQVDPTKVLRKLRGNGVLLTALKQDSAWEDIRQALTHGAADSHEPYAHWYVDGGNLSPAMTSALPNTVAVGYGELAPLRKRVLDRMEATRISGSGGAEQMRTRLTSTSVQDVGAQEVTSDPVLQRFYTELFTESSGPQIFSTSFVQWTGRELARRAQPRTMLLHYTPRASHRELDAMFATAEAGTLDPQRSFRDAEMDVFYNWIEMNRITAPGKLTFVAWIEAQSLAVIVGASAPAGTACETPLTIAEALENFV